MPLPSFTLGRATALLAAPLLAALALAPGAALAHPKLVASAPKADASVATTKIVSLSFSEPLILALSKISVTSRGKPVALAHQDLSKDGKTLIATLAQPLPPGGYEAGWSVVSTDTHKVAGKIGFIVK